MEPEELDAKRFNKKSIKSKKKLENFFGQNIPVDVSLKDIEHLGLKAILASRVPLCYFLYQLLEEHSSENLFFYLEVDLYEHTRFQSRQMMIDIGIELYDTFLRTDSEFEVNIPQKIKAPVLDALKAGHHDAFAGAKEHILKLMEPVFQKFKNSPIFERMRRELGYTSVYNKQARNYAVRMLLQNLDKTLPKNKSAQNVNTNLAQERNDMIRAMLHAFCEMKLGIDFIDRDLQATDIDGPDHMLHTRKPSSIQKDSILEFDIKDDSFAAYLDNM